jgi:hypothetical protein
MNIESIQQTTIEAYINALLQEFELTKDELLEVWEECKPSINIDVDNSGKSELTESLLSKKKIDELKEMCRSTGYKVTGTKKVLIARLLGQADVVDRKKSKKSTKKNIANVLNKHILVSEYNIRRNQYGNYEHAETGFVFDEINKMVVGKQSADGGILNLTPSDIELCIKYRFSYVLPTNLNIEEEKDVVDTLSDIDLE